MDDNHAGPARLHPCAVEALSIVPNTTKSNLNHTSTFNDCPSLNKLPLVHPCMRNERMTSRYPSSIFRRLVAHLGTKAVTLTYSDEYAIVERKVPISSQAIEGNP